MKKIINARLVSNLLLFEDDIVIEKKIIPININLHWHDFFEIDIITSGCGYTIFNGVKHKITPGLTSFSFRTDFHEYIVESPLTLYNIQFNESLLSKEVISSFSMDSDFIITLDSRNTNEIIGYSETILFEKQNNLKLKKKYIELILECIIIILIRNHDKQFHNIKQVNNTIINDTLLYLQNNFMNSPSLNDISQKFFINPIYFSSLFKKSTGKNYSEYLRELKLNYSLKLIRCTSLSVTEIAFRCGYKTFSHYLREFKEYFDNTPTAMRNKNI